MATETEMGEIEELHSNSKEEDEISDNILLNGDINDVSMEEEEEDDDEDEDSQNGVKKQDENDEPMQIDEEIGAKSDEDEVDKEEEGEDEEQEEEEEGRDTIDGSEKTDNEDDKRNNEEDEEDEKNKEKIESDNKDKEENEKELNGDVEIHEIIDDEEEDEEEEDDEEKNKVIELNDSGEGEGDDVMIIEAKENGTIDGNKRHQSSDELEIIELDSSPSKNNKKLQKLKDNLVPRRSIRNLNKQKSYVESDKDETTTTPQSTDESDIEEILPQDPLAVGDVEKHKSRTNKHHHINSSSTIVVKDTKRLVEIAAKSTNQSNSGGKKEPTLVIIDTNSILSGRGPVPINSSNKNSSVNQNFSTILPMALPAQGMYPPNMRATITPIPLNSNVSSSSSSSTTLSTKSSAAPLLPTLTDDMFVVEAPSFIVPYVYEKPPVKDLKEFVQDVKKEVLKNDKKDREDDDEDYDEKNDEDAHSTSSSTKDDEPYSYFSSPLGKFFIDIGFNLVQEFVQSDLLRQQKRKRDREGGHNPLTNKTIHSLIKNLEFSKENNEPFKIPMKKCEFCNFKTESQLTLSHHLEQPHMKNYVYKCNFCAYEIRSPHDILFHMEAEHAVRGRLERAPAFHQCPNCPFEDNQKGKLSRHLVACMRKFKPEKNLEPPFEWEPPAKIPRVPKSRQGLNVSAYQAMKQSQLQFLSKMQLLNSSNNSTHPLHRGRGRPTLGTGSSTTSGSVKGQVLRTSGMLYKQSLGGGSVLVPTNYQLSGNQVYQVVGGQELGGRIGHPGQMAFVPNMPSATSTITFQQNQSKNKSVHQPSISITPLPRQSSSSSSNLTQTKPGDTNSKNSFVICEICDGYIKDLEQLRNHMQWIHKVKIHPKMIYNRPPLNCQKCQFRFFTDQGLERHLLGSHGLVTSSMQDAANKSKDAGRCPVCGRVYQWKLLNHVARDHNMTLKPAHLSYKCTVCTATFGMYKQFENHVYSAHSVVAKRVMDKKNNSSTSNSNNNKNSSATNNSNNNNNSDTLMKPLKINDEITIIPQPAKSVTSSSSGGGASTSKDATASTSKNADSTTSNNSTEPQLPSNGTE